MEGTPGTIYHHIDQEHEFPLLRIGTRKWPIVPQLALGGVLEDENQAPNGTQQLWEMTLGATPQFLRGSHCSSYTEAQRESTPFK